LRGTDRPEHGSFFHDTVLNKTLWKATQARARTRANR
jgi:hypothetical protein